MPEVKVPWMYHRHFAPLTSHSTFSPECAISPLPLTQHQIFPREDAEAPIVVHHSEPGGTAPTTAPSKVLILKPRGEVSRISRGGYNLQEKLGWLPREYEEIRTFVTHLAQEHLAIGKPWSRQSKDALHTVFIKAKERYPQLLQYDGDWVVSDFLRIYLKNSSGRI